MQFYSGFILTGLTLCDIPPPHPLCPFSLSCSFLYYSFQQTVENINDLVSTPAGRDQQQLVEAIMLCIITQPEAAVRLQTLKKNNQDTHLSKIVFLSKRKLIDFYLLFLSIDLSIYMEGTRFSSKGAGRSDGRQSVQRVRTRVYQQPNRYLSV